LKRGTLCQNPLSSASANGYTVVSHALVSRRDGKENNTTVIRYCIRVMRKTDQNAQAAAGGASLSKSRSPVSNRRFFPAPWLTTARF
jgi:hypothetical protein